ncbi:MAG: SPOR domain-containing protein [Muribaculaceae bacterium]|nr:SPOR domain-containing protein [Muribaculaceae bacterium]MBR6489325.1 SPOR domain-containing protein [Muribaculaceae bacterium]
MRRFIKFSLPLLLLALMAFSATDAQAKTKPRKQIRTVYYIVCGSYSSLDQAIEQSEQMSEVMFYPVYKTTVKGKTVYRLCCQCYYSKAHAEKDLKGFLSGFKSDDWWIWQSKGFANCVYRPLSPKGDGERIPELRPLTKPLTE